jgi:NO-binding membrane sensor protein with MHYT domain
LGEKERKKSKQCLFVAILLTFGIVYVSAEYKGTFVLMFGNCLLCRGIDTMHALKYGPTSSNSE